MSDKEQGHVEILGQLYRRWNDSKGTDTKAWIDIMDERISFRSLGATTPAIGFSRDGYSRADVERYFTELAGDWEMLDYEVEQMIAQGDHVAVLAHCSWRNRHTGKAATTMKADFFRFADGRVTEFAELFDTAGAVAAASG